MPNPETGGGKVDLSLLFQPPVASGIDTEFTHWIRMSKFRSYPTGFPGSRSNASEVAVDFPFQLMGTVAP